MGGQLDTAAETAVAAAFRGFEVNAAPNQLDELVSQAAGIRIRRERRITVSVLGCPGSTCKQNAIR